MKSEVIERLRKDILAMEGFKLTDESKRLKLDLGPMTAAFPGETFPCGAVHEFLSATKEDAAATTGFIAGLLSGLMRDGGICLWISTRRTLFPPALRLFGIDPEKVIFIDLSKTSDILWMVEEALKCEALAAVFGDISEIDFAQSRRFQLAVEHSRVTGLIHRYQPRNMGTNTFVARWKISSLPGTLQDGLPGVGDPSWRVELIKIRNGRPGTWVMQWANGGFRHSRRRAAATAHKPLQKVG
ncbi:ImuA family protein [Taibaiella koreensis]|uniref:ImuA family protein n=1 Tax=Taibaiella koreensis TaxID=1268548 RepID=UPI000E59F8EE|nr:Error-prone repair protein ImuA [Taibaiella koreensis]